MSTLEINGFLGKVVLAIEVDGYERFYISSDIETVLSHLIKFKKDNQEEIDKRSVSIRLES